MSVSRRNNLSRWFTHEARSKIQSELIDLLIFLRTQWPQLEASAYLRVTGLLATTGFSLWRAAFLFDHETRKHEQYLNNVEKLVSKIISDNTIGFTDDKNTWSLCHYIGVARSSLLEAASLLSRPMRSAKFHQMEGRLIDVPLLQDTAARSGRFAQHRFRLKRNFVPSSRGTRRVMCTAHPNLRRRPSAARRACRLSSPNQIWSTARGCFLRTSFPTAGLTSALPPKYRL